MTVFGAVILGLILGSFYNVYILRYISGESVVFPPSHCLHCLHRLAWYELLPVVSYLCLRGRCSYCGVRISLQYPLVELLSGVVAGALAWRFGLGPALAVHLAAAGVLIVASGIDARIGILPDVLLVPATLIAIPAGALLLGHGWLTTLSGCLLGGGSFWLLSVLYRRFRGRDGLGLGDAKLMALLGALAGPLALPSIVLMASLAALAFSLIARHAASDSLPFGPWLSAGFITYTLFNGVLS